jgi:hypothetical protein
LDRTDVRAPLARGMTAGSVGAGAEGRVGQWDAAALDATVSPVDLAAFTAALVVGGGGRLTQFERGYGPFEPFTAVSPRSLAP